MKSRFLMAALLLYGTAAGAAVAQIPANVPSPAPAAATEPVSPAKAKAEAARAEAAKQLAGVDDVNAVLEWIAQARKASAYDAEMAGWERLVALRPHVGRYRYEMAARYAQEDRKTEAYNSLLELQGQGYTFDPKADTRFDKVSTTEIWEYVAKGFASNKLPFGEGKVAYTLPKQDLLIESVAWDESRKQLLVGSAREGAVYRVEKSGKLVPLVQADAENGLWAVFDLVVDAKRSVLWVASTAMPHFKNYNAENDLGRAGIFKFDLKTGKFLKKFLSPTIVGQNYILSSIALGKDGEVYAADGVNNAVYMVRDDQFRRLFHWPALSSIRGLAVSGDGKLLYVADHERGLLGMDLATSKPFDVRVPPKLSLGLIEGIAWSDGGLVVVQNTLPPSRIMRFGLSPDGHDIEKVSPISANDPALTAPTLGTMAGNTFYVIANSQRANYDRFGLLRDKSKLEGTRIFVVEAGSAAPALDPPKLKNVLGHPAG